MPQIFYPSEPITLLISNYQVEETIIKRKAVLQTMLYDQMHKELTLVWSVQFYAQNADGSYGESMVLTIPSQTKKSIADNTTYVNPSNGEIIQPSEGVDYMGQYDYFYMLADTTPLIVNDMIRQYGAAVDWG